jgi:hypothetical protein
MAAIRFGDDQKKDLVERYGQGEATQDLAAAFGCSPNTVIRVVKGVLGEELYGEIKRQRGSRSAPSARAESPTEPPLPSVDSALAAAGDEDDAGPGLLAIADADDFGDDDSDDGVDDGELEDGEFANSDGLLFGGGVPADPGGFDRDQETNIFVTVPVGLALEDRPPAPCRPLETAPLPASLYMLVDKTVELQARPLSDFPELGHLPDGERQRQALVLFANPRQAKRHCGRTQRVIKLPDSQVIHRTAPYLLGQGITRLVLEGSVYSLPGS